MSTHIIIPSDRSRASAKLEAERVAQQRVPLTGATLAEHGMRTVRYVPVSFVAKDWKVSARRIRALLVDSRLEGVRRDNGYWEVAYPYRFTFGQRGPALKRAQKQERNTE